MGDGSSWSYYSWASDADAEGTLGSAKRIGDALLIVHGGRVHAVSIAHVGAPRSTDSIALPGAIQGLLVHGSPYEELRARE